MKEEAGATATRWTEKELKLLGDMKSRLKEPLLEQTQYPDGMHDFRI